MRQGGLHRSEVLFALEAEDLPHLHAGPPLDLPIEVEKRSPQPARRSLAQRRLAHSRKPDEDQMRRLIVPFCHSGTECNCRSWAESPRENRRQTFRGGPGLLRMLSWLPRLLPSQERP